MCDDSLQKHSVPGRFLGHFSDGRELVSVACPNRAMLDAIEQHDIDLVVMGRGGHGQRNLGWVGSTCYKMVRSSPCPILIVPE